MPTPEQQVDQPTGALEGMPEVSEQSSQQLRTVAVRVQDGLHAQLSFIAQLSGTSISEEIRRAIEQRITSVRDDPELVARAQEVREQIEREAAARTAAIAGFMGTAAVGDEAKPSPSPTRGRQAPKRGTAGE